MGQPDICVRVTLQTARWWATEISWNLGDCEGQERYQNNRPYHKECCFSPSLNEVTLTCKDSHGDGWNGAYININGQTYCGEEEFSNGHNFGRQVTLPRTGYNFCPDEDIVVVSHIEHVWQGANGRYFYFHEDDWTRMNDGEEWHNGQRFRIDQYRDGERIRQNKWVVIWNNGNGIHGRYDPYGAAINGDWQPGDRIALPGRCE